jgi:hypothetical protein
MDKCSGLTDEKENGQMKYMYKHSIPTSARKNNPKY